MMILYKTNINFKKVCNLLFLLSKILIKDLKIIYYKDYIYKNKIKDKKI